MCTVCTGLYPWGKNKLGEILLGEFNQTTELFITFYFWRVSRICYLQFSHLYGQSEKGISIFFQLLGDVYYLEAKKRLGAMVMLAIIWVISIQKMKGNAGTIHADNSHPKTSGTWNKEISEGGVLNFVCICNWLNLSHRIWLHGDFKLLEIVVVINFELMNLAHLHGRIVCWEQFTESKDVRAGGDLGAYATQGFSPWAQTWKAKRRLARSLYLVGSCGPGPHPTTGTPKPLLIPSPRVSTWSGLSSTLPNT